MSTRVLGSVAAPFAIFCAVVLSAQRYGEWGRPCDLQLAARFSAPWSHGVVFQGQEFLTQWASVDQTPPLEPVEWYAATPDRHPLNVDGTYRWDDARVEVYCYVVRTPYFVSYRANPTGNYSGTLRRVDVACGEGGGDWGISDVLPVGDPEYDPYQPIGPGGGGCEGSGSGSGEGTGTQYEPGDSTGGETVEWETGIGNGGASACGDNAVVEYVCIDIWDAELGTWVEWNCGYATTC